MATPEGISDGIQLLVENVKLSGRIQEMESLASEQKRQLDEMKENMEAAKEQVSRLRMKSGFTSLPLIFSSVICSCVGSFEG